MEAVRRSESHDHVLLQYYKLTNVLPNFNITPPNTQILGMEQLIQQELCSFSACQVFSLTCLFFLFVTTRFLQAPYLNSTIDPPGQRTTRSHHGPLLPR